MKLILNKTPPRIGAEGSLSSSKRGMDFAMAKNTDCGASTDTCLRGPRRRATRIQLHVSCTNGKRIFSDSEETRPISATRSTVTSKLQVFNVRCPNLSEDVLALHCELRPTGIGRLSDDTPQLSLRTTDQTCVQGGKSMVELVHCNRCQRALDATCEAFASLTLAWFHCCCPRTIIGSRSDSTHSCQGSELVVTY